MKLKPRLSRKRLVALTKQFPVVAVLGQRQVGKSTLVQQALPGYAHLDLENPSDLARVERDLTLILETHSRLAIDEAQRFPALFPTVRNWVDRHPRAQIVLLGSASPRLFSGISESLTGRVAFLDLPQVSALEADWRDLLCKGGLPALHWSPRKPDPETYYPAYLRTYLEQDLPNLGLRLPAPRLYKLLGLLAHNQGSLCNLTELGTPLGVSYNTIDHYLDLFEGTFLLRKLPPFHGNLKKRLVKTPKTYLRDTGLWSTLAGVEHSWNALSLHPKIGPLWEGFCIEQILGLLQIFDPAARGSFYRTHSGQEVDLILERRGEIIPIEIKFSRTPRDWDTLAKVREELGAKRAWLLHLRTEKSVEVQRGIWAIGLRDFLRELRVT